MSMSYGPLNGYLEELEMLVVTSTFVGLAIRRQQMGEARGEAMYGSAEWKDGWYERALRKKSLRPLLIGLKLIRLSNCCWRAQAVAMTF